MSSKLKSWFFSTIRNTNSRGKYVNFNDGSEPDQVTFQNLLDTTVLKKADGDYQDQADYVAVNAISNTKFTTADNLPIVENSVDGSITLDVTAATTNSEKTKYKINPHFVSDIDQISPDRDTNVFVNPNNLPKVAVEIVGTPISGQSPLVVGNTITSELNNVDFYETFKLRLNVLTSSFISHSGVLLSTVLNTLRTDVDAKVSDAELAAEVSNLNISIATKADKVTPSIGLNGNGTKVTVNAEGVVTNVNRANASDLKNDSFVAGSTIKDALNNLNSTLSGDLIATVVPNISTETSNFNAVIGTKHFVDTSGGNIICSLPAVIDSASGDLIMVYKATSDANTITVVDTHLSFVLLQHKDNALFHFSDDRWSFVGIASPISQTVTNGVTNKSPSENAVFDAIENSKGFVKDAVVKVAGETLEVDKINLIDANIDTSFTLPTASLAYVGKVLIVKLETFGIYVTINGSVHGSIVLTKFRDSIIFSCVEKDESGVYWWYDISKSVDLITQTVTDGVTTKSPSEDAVFDAIYAKGLVKSNAWKNNGVGTFTLEADKYNIVNYSNTNIEILLPAVEVDKTIIVQGTTQDGSGAVNFTINNIKIGGADLGTPYSVTVTNEKEVLIFYGNYYGWHLIGHSNKTIDLSTKLDLDGGNANQDIDIDGFGVNAKHFKVNGTAGAGHIGLKHQSASITASASESSIGADSVGDPVWKNDGGAIDKLELQSNKTSIVTGNEASTIKYLTVKGVYDYVTSIGYPIPNYYRVDLNNGNDSTGIAGREDKPYRLIQTVWDLIATGSTAQITIEIVGDYTFTTHAINTGVAKDNITFLFKGKIVYAVPASTSSRPLFTFSNINNNLTFVVPNYTQTTQGGFIYTVKSSGHRYIIDNMQILLGIDASLNNNDGFRCLTGTNESYFQCNNMTVSLTGDGSGLKGYLHPFVFGANGNVRINTFKITGTVSVASTNFYAFYTAKSIYIENLIADNSYTNITTYGITYYSMDSVFVNNINISAGGTTTISITRSLFNGTINNLTIMSGSILNYSTITSSAINNVNLGHLTINGIVNSNYIEKNINLLGNITKTVANQTDYFMFQLGQNGQINGNGFKVYHADPTYIGASAVIIVNGSVASPKATFINNLTLYNTNIATGSTQAFVPIMYYGANPITLRFRNLVVSSQIDTNSHANTSFIRPYNEATSYTCRIEGNVATNYLKNITNLTNDADIDLINEYKL